MIVNKHEQTLLSVGTKYVRFGLLWIPEVEEAVISCHGVLMTSAEPEQTDENHKIFLERVEDKRSKKNSILLYIKP